MAPRLLAPPTACTQCSLREPAVASRPRRRHRPCPRRQRTRGGHRARRCNGVGIRAAGYGPAGTIASESNSAISGSSTRLAVRERGLLGSTARRRTAEILGVAFSTSTSTTEPRRPHAPRRPHSDPRSGCASQSRTCADDVRLQIALSQPGSRRSASGSTATFGPNDRQGGQEVPDERRPHARTATSAPRTRGLHSVSELRTETPAGQHRVHRRPARAAGRHPGC